MKWSKIALSSRFYISSRHPQSLKNPSNLICIKIYVTPATLIDSQCVMVKGPDSPVTFLSPKHRPSSSNKIQFQLFLPIGTFCPTRWNFWYQLMGKMVPANGTASRLWSLLPLHLLQYIKVLTPGCRSAGSFERILDVCIFNEKTSFGEFQAFNGYPQNEMSIMVNTCL